MAYVAESTEQFLKTLGITHHISSAYNPHANLRAETAVKSMKRLITNNTGVSGTLNTNKVAAALLSYRNTPDRDTGLSPAQILFARQLKDTLPANSKARERALAKRHLIRQVDLQSKAKPLKPLELNDVVQVQNQRGPHANKWDLSGQVVEILPYDAYLIKMDGSGRITKRNRRYLRPIIPFNTQLQQNNDVPSQTHVISHDTGPTAVSREATTPL